MKRRGKASPCAHIERNRRGSEIFSADSRQGLPEREIHDSLSPDRGAYTHETAAILEDVANCGGVLPERVAAHLSEDRLDTVSRNERDELPFIRDEKRVESEDLACAANRVADRDERLVDLHPHFLP